MFFYIAIELRLMVTFVPDIVLGLEKCGYAYTGKSEGRDARLIMLILLPDGAHVGGITSYPTSLSFLLIPQ